MKPIQKCRACGSRRLTKFLDLGKQYLSDFRDDDSKTPMYPLVAVFCDSCKLVQLKHSTPQAEMYHERYGFKSGVGESIKKDLETVVTHGFQWVNDPKSWLDIASNDGTLLSFVPEDVYTVGVDPVSFLCKEAEDHADLVLNEYFTGSSFTADEKFDVITSVSCFYDMPNPSQFVKDVKKVLSRKGVWIIQQNYLMSTMQLSAVDNFCHEHLEYYTLWSLENLLERFDLEVNEVQLSTVNGGSIRTVVTHAGTHDIDESVDKQRVAEWDYGIGHLTTYQEFAESISDNLNQLHRLVTDLKADGKTICILAASTRGATIWQAADIGATQIDYAVERNEAKVGKMFTAIGVPIVSEERFRLDKPDYAIVGPWFFLDQFIDREAAYLKAGGRLITPLPEVRIIEG